MTILSRRPARDFLDWVASPGFAAPAVPILPFAVGIARPKSPAQEPGSPACPEGRSGRRGPLLQGRPAPPSDGRFARPARDGRKPRDSWPARTDEDRWTIGDPVASEIDLTAFATRANSLAQPAPAPMRFSIRGFNYTVREIPAGECGSVAFELHKYETNHHYHVIRDGYGLVACDCPGYLMRREGTGGMCKHGSKLVELGLIPAPLSVLPPFGRREPVATVVPATHDRAGCPAPRPHRFEPSPAEMAEAAQLFADLAEAC